MDLDDRGNILSVKASIADLTMEDMEGRYRQIIDSVDAAVFIFAGDKNIFANKASEEITGYSVQELVSMSFWNFIHPDYRAMVKENGRARQRGEAVPPRYELMIVTKGGQEKWISFAGKIIDIRGVSCVLGIVTDITQRKKSEVALRKLEEKNQAILRAIPDLMFVLNPDGTIVDYHANDPQELYLEEGETVLGKKIQEVMPQEFSDICLHHIQQAINTGSLQVFEFILPIKSERREYEARLSLKEGREVLAIVRDVTAKKKAEAKISFLAYHDVLTGLPNRVSLMDSLRALPKQGVESAAVLFVDLDRFKIINDSLGHVVGDQVLEQAATRLQEALIGNEILARQGGDEFIVVHPGGNEKEAQELSERLLESLQKPFLIVDREFYVSASIGIAMMPENGRHPEELLMNADTAMYEVKKLGGSSYKFYRTDLHWASVRKLEVEADLRRALKNNEFRAFHQNFFGLPGRQATGAEILVRWEKEGEILLPGNFISVAEETGIILPLGKWVLEEACRIGKIWTSKDPGFRVAVNISPKQFSDTQLYTFIEEALERTGLPGKNLEIEITEDAVIANPELATETLYRLKNLGIRISLDDFGQGHSSLGQLHRLPIDTLKIDRSFIRNVHQNIENSAIVRAILAMAQELRLSVIAEGVETKEQLAWLELAGCKEVQGYCLGKPKPTEV